MRAGLSVDSRGEALHSKEEIISLLQRLNNESIGKSIQWKKRLGMAERAFVNADYDHAYNIINSLWSY